MTEATILRKLDSLYDYVDELNAVANDPRRGYMELDRLFENTGLEPDEDAGSLIEELESDLRARA